MTVKVLTRIGNKILLKIYVQFKSSTNALVGLHNGELKVKVTAVPINGKANAKLSQLIADEFAVPLRQVIIEQGLHSRHKRICIIEPKRIPALLIKESIVLDETNSISQS